MRLEELDRCVKCGTCRTLCPVFRATGREGGVARGKIAVLRQLSKDGKPFSRETLKLLDACVLCGSCQYVCPLDVPFPDIMEEARAEQYIHKQVPTLKRMLMAAIASGPAWEVFRTVLSGLPEESGLTFKLPVIQRVFPHPDEPLLANDTVRYVPPVKDSEHCGDLLFFPGCATRYLMGNLGRKTVRVLTRLGFGVFLDARFHCCGFPHATAGDRERARAMREHNTALVERYVGRAMAITTGCATCGSALKRTYDMPLPVRDINEVLVDVLTPDRMRRLDISVLYHAPCHLAKHQHVTTQPKQLLEQAAELLPVENPEACCGFGGSFSVWERGLSRKISDKRTQDFIQTVDRAGIRNPVVVTSCPGCMMQLADGIARAGTTMDVKHIIDIIDEAMEGKDEKENT